MVHIYYDSKTGNVNRFMTKVIQITGWAATQIDEHTVAEETGHLVTYTTNFGQVSTKTAQFMANNHQQIASVSSSGNRNWGRNFALAADTLSDQYDLPVALKFELSGTMTDVNEFIDIIKNQYYDRKRRSEKLDIA